MSSLFAVPAGRLAKWLVALVWLVVVVAVIGANLPGKFADAEKNESTSFLPGDAESTKALQVTERLQGGEKAATVIVYRRDGGLTAADRRAIANDVAQLNRITRRFDNSTPFGNPADPRSRRPYQLSQDGTTALIANQLTGTGEGDDILDPVDAYRKAVSSGPQRRPAGEGRRAGRLLGGRDQGLRGHQRHAAAGAAFLLVLVLLILIYRSPIFWFFPILAVAFAEIAARGDRLGAHRGRASPSTASRRRSCPCSSSARGPTTRCCSSPATARSCAATRTSTRRWRSRCARAGPAIFASGLTVIAALLCLSLAKVNGTAASGRSARWASRVAMRRRC